MKISKLVKCKCDGWIHIAQGPCSCWVCQATVSFEKWQTGKAEELRDKPGFGAPVTLDPDARWWNPDDRDRLKDRITDVRRGPGYFVRERREHIAGYLECFSAKEDKFGLEVQERFEYQGETKTGYICINKQFGL